MRINPSIRRCPLLAAAAAPLLPQAGRAATLQGWALNTPQCAGIPDVAPAPDGGDWFSARRSGHLGWFDPKSVRTELVALGLGSSPHGVIQGPDGAAWLTDGDLQALVRVSRPQREVKRFDLPAATPYAKLTTCAFDAAGDLWFTGQSGVVGRGALKTGVVTVKDAPGGRGPYGICATPPVDHPRTDAVCGDERDIVWISEWASHSTFSFDPERECSERHVMPRDGAQVRQIPGRKGEVWLPGSGTEHIAVIRS